MALELTEMSTSHIFITAEFAVSVWSLFEIFYFLYFEFSAMILTLECDVVFNSVYVLHFEDHFEPQLLLPFLFSCFLQSYISQACGTSKQI